MPQRRRPKRGSRAYGPRKRAQSQTPRLDSWPEISGAPKIQGFAGYKAGMTHAFVVDKRAKSTTSGMEVQTPVTVIEVPPMKIAAVRFYENDILGLKTAGEVWAKDLDPLLDKRLNVPKNHDESTFAKYDGLEVEDVRVLAYTQPKKVSGVPKKVPDLMELRIGGGTIPERTRSFSSTGRSGPCRGAKSPWLPTRLPDGSKNPVHGAAVIGDTVGDPCKDTSGPSLNILIKLMSMVSIVFAPVVLKFSPIIQSWLHLN